MAGRNLFATVEPTTTGRNLFDLQPDQSQGFVPQPFTVNEQDDVGVVEGTGQSLLQGATLGFSDEIQSVIAATVAAPFVSDKTFGQLMTEARQSFREDQEKFREENPALALGGEIVGGIVTGGVAGLAKTAAKQTLKETTKQGVKQGAAIGAVVGVGQADLDEFFSVGTIEEGIEGVFTGTIFGGSFPLLAKAFTKAGKLIPKELPRKMLDTALKLRPGLGNKERERAVNTALREGIMPTVAGLERITNKIQKLDGRLNKIIDGATERGVLISKKTLFSELKQLRKDLGGVKIDAADDLKRIDAVEKAFDFHLKKIRKSKLTPREVQDLKRDAYRRIVFDMNQTSAGFAETETKKAIVRGSRKSLESLDDDVASINRREGDLLQLGEELESVVGRLDNRNFFSIDTAAKLGFGAATQSPIGVAIGGAAAIGGAPRVKAKVALMLHNLQKLSEATVNKNLSPEALVPILEMANRIENFLNSQVEDLDE